MKFFLIKKNLKKFCTKTLNVNFEIKKDSVDEFRRLLMEEASLASQIKGSNYNFEIKHMIKNAYHSLNFNEKIKTTET